MAFRSPDNHKFCFYALPVFLPFPAVCRVRWCPDNHMHAQTYEHTYARARGFLDSNF